MEKIWRAISLMADFLILATTLGPRSNRGIKVFGRLSFLGGPSTKIGQLSGVVAGRFQKYSTVVCLSAVKVPLFLLSILKRIGTRIVVIQDGVFYPQWAGSDYREKNLYLNKLNNLADHTFFQSEFALSSYKEWVGIPPKSFSVLINSVDLEKFQPIENKIELGKKPKILFFHDLSRASLNLWQFFASLLKEHQLEMKRFEWRVIGRRFENVGLNEVAFLESQENIGFSWSPSTEELPRLIAQNNILLYLRYNDVCPNKVLEGLACGLPVVCLSAGGTKELVGDAGIVVPVREHFSAPIYPNPTDIFSSLDQIVSNYDSYRNLAVQRSRQFSLKDWQAKIISFKYPEGTL